MKLIWNNTTIDTFKEKLAERFLIFDDAYMDRKNSNSSLKGTIILRAPMWYDDVFENNIITKCNIEILNNFNDTHTIRFQFDSIPTIFKLTQGMNKVQSSISKICDFGKKYNVPFNFHYEDTIFKDDQNKSSLISIKLSNNYNYLEVEITLEDDFHSVSMPINHFTNTNDENEITAIVNFIYEYIEKSLLSFIKEVSVENILKHYIEYLKTEIKKL